MVVIVLTGGIGSGKSTAAEFFRLRGAAVIDLDDVATEVMGPGSAVLTGIVSEFGSQVVGTDGTLDRAALAGACFADSTATRRLDALVHPAVADATRLILAELRRSAAPPKCVVIQVPLLAEAPDFADMADLVVAISAPAAVRVERAVARGMDRTDVRRRLAVQAPDSARAALADVVIENDGTRDEYLDALERFWTARIDCGAIHE